jgi:2-polyprenyl-3-methyl-5-hydroxy-6-metoxy-1,4-benzoquinol methylase
MQDSTEDSVKAGIALYSRFLLAIYDWYMLGCNCRFLWRCPSRYLLDLYNRHVSANHLDVGVGTGYFMDRCRFPGSGVRLALMDLNTNSLRAAGRRLARYRPEIYRRNAMKPFDIQAPPFDSVGMVNLLHCLPGNLRTKSVVFEYAQAVMNPGAVLFGSTILCEGVARNRQTTLALKLANRMGWMTNQNDSLEDLREALRRVFPDGSVDVIGCEALFWGRK